MFFYKVEGHMPKLSSFGRGKTIRPKKSLTSLLHAALQFQLTRYTHAKQETIVKLKKKGANVQTYWFPWLFHSRCNFWFGRSSIGSQNTVIIIILLHG